MIEGTDVFIGLSGPGIIDAHDLQKMNPEPFVFAMANPNPEVKPEEAAPYVRVMATGRSDYPNQINNVLAFPGIFRGALDARATAITEDMKLAAARGIASVVGDDELDEDYIIPSVFNRDVAREVAAAVSEVAERTLDAPASPISRPSSAPPSADARRGHRRDRDDRQRARARARGARRRGHRPLAKCRAGQRGARRVSRDLGRPGGGTRRRSTRSAAATPSSTCSAR